MKTQPNPALRNTAIFVGNDAELRKKAIEYYESEGYEFTNEQGLEYIGTYMNTDINLFSDFNKKYISSSNQYKIITLPTEQKSEYPKMMLVSDEHTSEFKRLVIGKFKGRYVAQDESDNLAFFSWEFAKELPIVELTVKELIEAYEKSNNVKVIIK
jgi:hypothetical protein